MLTFADGVLLLDKPANSRTYCGWQGTPLAVPSAEYARRVQAVQAALLASALDAVVITAPEDLRYLTGFFTIGDATPQSLIMSRQCPPLMVARLLEVDLVVKRTWVSQVWSCPDAGSISNPLKAAMARALGGALEPRGVVGVQPDVLSATTYQTFARLFPGLELRDASKLVEHIRLCKSAAELNCIRQAAAISEVGMRAGLARIAPGVLLSELCATSFSTMLEQGSEEPSYLPIIRTTDPSGHGSWEVGERVQSGLIFLEMAASVRGHHAPLMRTAYLLAPDEAAAPAWVQEAEDLINVVFTCCLPLMVPGALASDIDQAGRDILLGNTFGAHMLARLGYTVGGTATAPTGNAGWGDADFSLVGHNHQPLREGMVFHFIPWLQKYNEPVTGPIGLSDAVLVTSTGGQRLGSMPLRIAVLRHGSDAASVPVSPPALSSALVSDTSAGACPEIMEALQQCNLGFQAAYENDIYSKRAKEVLAAHLGAEAEVYFVATGTAANTLAIAAVTRPYHAILCSQSAHLAKDECGAPEKFSGCKVVTIPDDPQGKVTVTGIRAVLAHLIPIPHRSQARVVSLSQSTEYGTVYTPAEIQAIADVAHAHGMLVHMDGARIFNACVALGVTIKQITVDVGVDLLSLGGTKNGLINAEAVVFFKPQPDFSYLRKQGMQLLSKMRFVSAQFEALLSGNLWHRNASHANRMAEEFSARLGQLPGVTFPYPVQTNLFFVGLPEPVVTVLKQEYSFLVTPEGIRLVTSFATTRNDIEEFVCKAAAAAKAEA